MKIPTQPKKMTTPTSSLSSRTPVLVGAGQILQRVDDPREVPGAVHPVVRTHPETGRKCLFLGRRRNAYLMGLSLDESEALLDALWQAAVDEDLVWSQEWQVGDMLMWDNRAVIHHRDSFAAMDRRLLWRTQLQGDAPY